ncbi:BON domain-containing protein [Cribrihabitans sp. XS_ASV171]
MPRRYQRHPHDPEAIDPRDRGYDRPPRYADFEHRYGGPSRSDWLDPAMMWDPYLGGGGFAIADYGYPRQYRDREFADRPRYSGAEDRRYASAYGTGYGRSDHDRGFLDRAADEVSSWFGDEDAEQRREQDHRGRGPKNYQRSDSRIEEDVNDRLTDHPRVDATEISVTVQDREVTLDGTVDSRAAKRAAEDCADYVSGVQHVQNNLRVQGPVSTSGKHLQT